MNANHMQTIATTAALKTAVLEAVNTQIASQIFTHISLVHPLVSCYCGV